MATSTPRRSTRIARTHTPKMSERKKSLFQSVTESQPESLTKHRRLPVVESDSESDECDLGIISTLDTSSSDELHDHDAMRTPDKTWGHELRSHKKKLMNESQGVKNFLKSPFTLHKYKSRYSCSDSASTPVTPKLQYEPVTPSSTRSCGSTHTVSSTTSRARKSLASLIADTESCSSSLKDLNFDTDSGPDSKENTPNKRRSKRNQKTPILSTFKGILTEKGLNESPQAVVCLPKMDISPTKMLKTPNVADSVSSPPKLHPRKSFVEIPESPDSNDSSINFKRLREECPSSDSGPKNKYPRLDSSVPKARHSLFQIDKFKEMLSTKSFYGKPSTNVNTSIEKKIENAIQVVAIDKKQSLSHTTNRRKGRKPGQINMGVKHKIRKPKLNKNRIIRITQPIIRPDTNREAQGHNMSVDTHNSSQDLESDKTDPFGKEKQTIEALLSQWDDDEDTKEPAEPVQELPCFNEKIIEDTRQIFEPVAAIPVNVKDSSPPKSSVILELGAPTAMTVKDQLPDVSMVEGHKADHGEAPQGAFLPVEGGYILVDEEIPAGEEDLPDLDEIERELAMLDEQIQKVVGSDNINVGAVIPSAGNDADVIPSVSAPMNEIQKTDEPKQLFSIFSKPNPGTNTPLAKGQEKNKKIIKTGVDQYILDAGQKEIGATQCKGCGVIYHIGDAQDEHDHLVYHNATNVLKFDGWRGENIVGRWEDARCIQVRAGTHNWKRVSALLERVVHPELGYANQLPRHGSLDYTAYLYVEKRQIVGCLIMELKSRAHKLIPGDLDCCSTEDYPVTCGVSRLWVHSNHRRANIATRLVDCGRASFLFGHVIRKNEVAFSAPTANGKAFAAKYCQNEQFYVYLD